MDGIYSLRICYDFDSFIRRGNTNRRRFVHAIRFNSNTDVFWTFDRSCCTNRNNYYVAFHDQKYTYIPSGVDLTFQNRPLKNRFCPFIPEVLEQSNNRYRFESFSRRANAT